MFGTKVNSTEPDLIQHKARSDQGDRSLHTHLYLKLKKNTPNIEHGTFKLMRLGLFWLMGNIFFIYQNLNQIRHFICINYLFISNLYFLI